MSLIKKWNDKRGSYRGAGAYSQDYASFDRSLTEYSGREFYSKVDGVGDYDGPFTGEVSRSSKYRWTKLADRMNTRGEGAYSKSGREGYPSRERPRKQSDGKAVGGQKYSGGSDPFDY